jgi:plastocyanin
VVATCAGGGSAPIWTFPVAFAPATARSTGAGAPSPSAAATQTVTFVLKEYAITPAPVTFVVRNAGTISHALVISGGGVNLATKDLAFQPGAREQIASTLAAGTYTFTCPVDGHANLGMKGTLIVTP